MHLVSPRTLLFLERDGRWLFLEGGPLKWFAGQLNGLGGHVEPGESVRAAAKREAREETGLEAADLRLAATIHVVEEPAHLLFVYRGSLPPGDLNETSEGKHVWHAPAAVADPDLPFVPDVRRLVPLLRDRADEPLSMVLNPPDDLR